MIGYRASIAWIAENDDFDIGDDEHGFIVTVCLVADQFGKTPAQVGAAVMRYRDNNESQR